MTATETQEEAIQGCHRDERRREGMDGHRGAMASRHTEQKEEAAEGGRLLWWG